MIKKLKLKFILISIISVFLVLVSTIAAINISNYAYIERDSKIELAEIVLHADEDFPGPPLMRVEPQQERPDGDKRVGFKENSFFVVIFDSDGNVEKLKYNHVFEITEEQCRELATKVYNGEILGRKYNYFRFTKESKDNGNTYIAFIDMKIELDEANKFLLISSLISVGAFAVLTGLIILASNIAFKPNEDAYRKQKKFITNASHELKTPLTIINADLDLIEMDNGKSEWSDSIRCQVDRLTTMTKQLVDLSRLEEDDKMNYPFEEFQLNDVANKVIGSFEKSFKKEGIKFYCSVQDNIPMYGSKYLIEDLLHIFLDNSVKYTGGINKESIVKVTKSNKGKIELKFSNTLEGGYEIDPKLVMERFYRSPSNKKDGSGVGLSIAQEIINLHKGKIKVEKEENTLTFTITF